MSTIDRLVSIATDRVTRNSNIDKKVDSWLVLDELLDNAMVKDTEGGRTATKETYIKAGLKFLDDFPARCSARINDIREVIADEKDTVRNRELEEIIGGIRNLKAVTRRVDRNEFVAAIGKDWDRMIELAKEEEREEQEQTDRQKPAPENAQKREAILAVARKFVEENMKNFSPETREQFINKLQVELDRSEQLPDPKIIQRGSARAELEKYAENFRAQQREQKVQGRDR